MLLWRKRASDDLLFVLYRIHTSHERTALATARDLFFSLRYSSTKHARVASHRTAQRESPAHTKATTAHAARTYNNTNPPN